MAPPPSAFVWLRVTTITFVYAESQDKPIPDFEEPSPLLFERAMFDVEQHPFTAANLTLQTLINTYPESEYASKAKQALDDPRIAPCGESWTSSSQCIDRRVDNETQEPAISR
jgi:hypothetical protein